MPSTAPSYLSEKSEAVTSDGRVITRVSDLDGVDLQRLVKPLALRIDWMI